MKNYIKKNVYVLILFCMTVLYIGYFSFFTITRYNNLYSSYFDLGIMHQATYNTFIALKTGDMSRLLEHTNPHGFEQVKRMAIHNDLILALLAPFYFINSSPVMLLILQSIILGCGAIAIYLICLKLLETNKRKYIFAICFSFAYLMYVPIQRANIFDFHGVTIATTFLLFMYYFWLIRNKRISLLFLILSLLCKEQIGLTTIFFGLYLLFCYFRNGQKKSDREYYVTYPLILIGFSAIWFGLSMKFIIPYFRGGKHFALEYYRDITITNPPRILTYIFNSDTVWYLFYLLGNIGFLSLLSPLHFLIAIPELAVNLLSSNWNMRNIIYHYTSVITPFVFISAVTGFASIKKESRQFIAIFIVVACTIVFSATKGPLPYSREADLFPFMKSREVSDVWYWSNLLKSDAYRISATGHIGPLFSSRRYFYTFSKYYDLSDYVIISKEEAVTGWQKEITFPAYEKLIHDARYKRIVKKGDLEIYSRKTN